MPKLSILICSLESRKKLLDRLLLHLEIQQFLLPPDSVEFLIETDNGEKTTGEKRNILLDRARGEYVFFVDDDDLLAPNALELILKAVEANPDAVGINLLMSWNGGKTERSFHFGQFNNQEWFQVDDPMRPGYLTYFRGANHLNPIKKELAQQVRFPEITQGEDKVYAYGICKLIKTMVDIDQPIYFYLFNPNK